MGRKKKEFTALTMVPLSHIKFPETEGVPKLFPDSVAELAQGLAREGQLEPILLYQSGRASPRIVSGRRRVLAAKLLGWDEISGVLLGDDLSHEIRVVERLQNGDYNPWELADALGMLTTRMGWSQAQLGAAIDKSRDFVANFLAIQQITPEARGKILTIEGADRLTTRHLRYVARSAAVDQVKVALKIITDQLSTTRLEREHHEAAPKTPSFHLIGIRDPLDPDGPQYPVTYRDWRKYHRQLTTDLRRIERQEIRELARARAAINEAKLLQKQVRHVAGTQRRKLEKELRQAKKWLEQLGGF